MNKFNKFVNDPIKTRLLYDFFISFFIITSLWIFFNIFSFPIIKFRYILLYPILYIIANYLFGIYGKFKTSSIFIKSIFLTTAAISTLIFFILLKIYSPLIIISTLFLIIFSILPRFFFNYNNQTNKNLKDFFVKGELPILIVGGAGYIGSSVVEKLLNKGYKVKVFDNFFYGKDSLGEFKKNNLLEIIEGDVSDLFKLTLALQNTGAVIHLAGLVGDPSCSIDDKLTRHINIVATRMLKEGAKAFNIQRFIFASSCSVYGYSEKIVNEDSKLSPVSLYAKTKIDSENELLGDPYDNFHPTILRFATVFGHSRRMRFDLVTNLFVAQAYNKGLIKVIGGNQWRPFIHVDDVAESIIKTLEAPINKVSRQVFNVGSNEMNLTISNLAKLVCKIIIKDKNNHNVKLLIKNDATEKRSYIVSFLKIKNILNFKTSTTLEQGIKEIFTKFKKNIYKKPFDNLIYSNFQMTKEIKKEFYSKNYQKKSLFYYQKKGQNITRLIQH